MLSADGNEAIDLFNTQAPDLIFMDMKMPGMNGIDTVDSINT
ncbi:response regulator [Bacteroides cellulosilyticus]|uniref:Response regulator n=1 Tax=Bacteroides cellulosilyticus TaxID=246787 RepID=A0AAW6MBK6_9BACE|nr:response regulator [Bacteroides cellulosilyticus]MDE8697663.1 response regulator [Bacteroides cellulosilyticus]